MTSHGGERSANTRLLTSVLEKLRTHAGITIDRLHSARADFADPLINLVANRSVAEALGSDPAAAAFALVSDCVREDLHGSQRIVADVILGLRLHSEALANAGVDDETTGLLYSSSLGRRRAALLHNWHQVQKALGHPVTAAPSDRALRGSVESAVLRELADRLIRRTTPSDAVTAPAAHGETRALELPSTGHVVVVGGAVMDATFHIMTLPAPETSTEAYGFDLSPGGKALTQAVAAARLGLKTSLIAAVTDDAFGEEIMRYLQNQGVDTSLIKRVRGRRTPVTGVLERELGDSIAVNWRNQGEVVLEAKDIAERHEQIAACDALLLTFEVPREVMQQTLTLVHRNPDNRPLAIVTPGQPYADEKISRGIFPRIDYLVAHPWELGHFAPQGLGPFDPDPVARSLLAFGLDTLCLLVNGGCTVYSQGSYEPISVPSIPSIYKETSASRDAFCAALASGLIDNKRMFTGQVALWAAAAMSCASIDFPLGCSMPDRQRIDTLLAGPHFSITTTAH